MIWHVLARWLEALSELDHQRLRLQLGGYCRCPGKRWWNLAKTAGWVSFICSWDNVWYSHMWSWRSGEYYHLCMDKGTWSTKILNKCSFSKKLGGIWIPLISQFLYYLLVVSTIIHQTLSNEYWSHNFSPETMRRKGNYVIITPSVQPNLMFSSKTPSIWLSNILQFLTG